MSVDDRKEGGTYGTGLIGRRRLGLDRGGEDSRGTAEDPRSPGPCRSSYRPSIPALHEQQYQQLDLAEAKPNTNVTSLHEGVTCRLALRNDSMKR